MRIVIVDDGVPVDSETTGQEPSPAAGACLVRLAEALANFGANFGANYGTGDGHDVICLVRCERPGYRNRVRWSPICDAPLWQTQPVDLLIATGGGRALEVAGGWTAPVGRLVLWGLGLSCARMPVRLLWQIWRQRPVMAFLSQAQARTLPGWLPVPRRIIPHGVGSAFQPHRQDPPSPRAAFLSDPHRGLADLLNLWERRVLPQVPGAELHVFSGSGLMAREDADLPETAALLARAGRTTGVVLHGVVPPDQLADRLSGMRAFCYPASVAETFCLPAAEAQALGLPGVVMARGALPERIQNGTTGFVTPAGDLAAFAEALIAVLEKDVLWSHLHRTTCERPVRRWADVAADFLALVPVVLTGPEATSGRQRHPEPKAFAGGVAAEAE